MTGLRVPVRPADHIRGGRAASTTLVEYGDYECPHCGASYPVVEAVLGHFGERLRLVYRHFPLSEIHPHAQTAAEVAEFAGAHNKFWAIHGLIFENQDRLSTPFLLRLAWALGLSQTSLQEALQRRVHAAKVKADFIGGVRRGVNGTPTFFLDGRRYEGPNDFAALVAVIDTRLAERQPHP
jgi:protein-disulfide isomerase